jgi:hypothetical protein
MKAKALNYTNSRLKNLLLCLLLSLLPARGLMAQPPSYVTYFKVQEGGHFYRQLHVCQDRSVLLVTAFSVTYLSPEGKVLWSYNSTDVKKLPEDTNKLNYNAGFGNIAEDEEGIYINAGAYGSPCLIKLNRQGEVLFDTIYYQSWLLKEDIMYALTNLAVNGEYLDFAAYYPKDLYFDSSIGSYDFTKGCYAFHRINKNTGERIYNHYECISQDSSNEIMKMFPVKGPEKGYILHGDTRPNRFSGNSKADNWIILTDSLGKIKKKVPMIQDHYFPKDPRISVSFMYVFDRVDAEEGNGIQIYFNVGSHPDYLPTDENRVWIVNLDKNLDTVSVKKYQDAKNWGVDEFENKFRFVDSFGNIRWVRNQSNYYVSDSFGGVAGKYTKEGAHYRVYKRIKQAANEYTAEYCIRHINEAGWAVSVPRVAMPQPNTPLWFDAEGYLHFPETLHGQECRIIDMQGRQLFQTKALDYFPKPDLPPGIYILQITNPRNHESQSFKLYKQ